MVDENALVGIAVFVIEDGKILLGKRKGSHGSGTWSIPGGLLEKNEGFHETGKREVREETGLEIEILDKEPIAVTNDIFEKEGRHFITLYFRGKIVGGELKVMEPNKCEEWSWFRWNNLPRPLFLPIKNLIKQNYNPFGNFT